MWIKRDFEQTLGTIRTLPIKVLKGPRQVGKSSLLARLGTHQSVYLDDLVARVQASENPRLFLDNLPSQIVLDEGVLAPELFPELKRRVDEHRRVRGSTQQLDVWITGSNQTLLQKNVRETLAGRANYFDLQTLSIHELGARWKLSEYLLRGGWPELYISPQLDHVRYLNDLISTFIENDIVVAAGIERRVAFTKSLGLIAGRIGQLINYSDIATNVGVEVTTLQSWCGILESNGIIRLLAPYFTNINKRLIKSPKIYFEDVALATRLQGWTENPPLLLSPLIGSLIENIAVGEVIRFFLNRGEVPNINYVRSKEKVEIDLLIHLPNHRCIAAEIKSKPEDLSLAQLKLLDSLGLNVIDRWVLSPVPAHNFKNAKAIQFAEIYNELSKALNA